MTAPGIERIRQLGILQPAPLAKMRPVTRPRIPHKQDGFDPIPRQCGWDLGVTTQVEATSKDQTMPLDGRRNRVQINVRRHSAAS